MPHSYNEQGLLTFRCVVSPYILDSQGQCKTETNKRPQLKEDHVTSINMSSSMLLVFRT